MSGWFTSLFGGRPQSQNSDVPKEEGDRLLQYLFGLVVEQKMVAELIEKYASIRKLPIEKRDHSYITLYTALENFLVKNRPPLTARFFTRESLRLEVRQQFRIQLLPLDFQLIFFSKQEQAVVLCSIASREMIRLLADSMGVTALQAVVDKVVKGTPLEGAAVDQQGLRIDTLPQEIRHISPDRIFVAFKVLNTAFFREISGLLGEQSSLALIERVYGVVKIRYDSDLVARFLECLPLGVLETERATFLSREDLEVKIQERTKALVQVQKELQVERDRANIIITSMGEGLISLDKLYRIALVNEAAEKLLGLPAKQLIGKHWEQCVGISKSGHEDLLNQTIIQKSLGQNEAYSMGLEDDLELHASDRRFPIAGSLSSLGNSGTGGIVMVFRDITQEKEANQLIEREVEQRTEQVQEARARLVSSINSLELGFIMTDSELNTLIMNRAAEDILTKDHATRAHKFTFTAVAKMLSDSINLEKESQQCLKIAKPLDFDNLPYGTRFLRIYISPIIHDSKAIGCAILIEDITEARVLARSKEEFFTIASHELRTPLIAIRGFASTIKELYPAKLKPEQVLTMVDRIDSSGTRLLAIVNTFLDVSRLEQGKMPIKQEPFVIDEVVKACVDELSSVAKDKQLELTFTQPTTPTTLTTDKNLVKQVLYNLVGNAIKFTEKGSITVKLTHKQGMVVVEVHDTGNGIPAQAQSLLFRKFQQTGDSLLTRDNSQGTGLGLYISKLIVEQLNGEIKLLSSTTRGSSFVFALPLKLVS